MSTDDLRNLAHDQIQLCDERVAVYEQIREHNAPRAIPERRLVPLELGLRLTATMREFWEEIEKNPPV
nr:hypothetical protein [Rhodococcus sp. KBW08]